MLTFILQRLLGALLVIFGVVSIVFLLIHMIPGDPVEIMLGESASTADREVLPDCIGTRPTPGGTISALPVRFAAPGYGYFHSFQAPGSRPH